MPSFLKLRIIVTTLSVLFICSYTVSAQALINIVTAENFYGEVAKEIGGPYVNVVSILNNPNQDPHLFTTSSSTAIALLKANIIIYNGIDYDPWMQTLLSNQKNSHIIVVADLMNVKNGGNPHIWYMPETIPTYAIKLVDTLNQIDPAHREYFQKQLNNFNQSYQPIFEKIKNLKQHFNNTSVIATEPVFNYMVEAIGLKMHGEGFQLSMMNDVPPTFSQVKQFEDDLRQHSVRIVIFNNQVINPSIKHMLSIAENEKIPAVGVSEIMPINLTYVQWILQELNLLENTLVLEKMRETHHDSIRE
ncbi:MAG: zinc ABC transporter substrate-binding protein [Gammaproteobacteria bacterium]|nr:zinc ABC transporter substrate-binding protein [Gammaproteobacteria bacterium]